MSENKYYIELKNLISTNPKGYGTILRHSKKYLLDWIYQKTKFAKDLNLTITTLVYFVLNKYQSLPVCCICGKEITKNVFSINMGYNQHGSKNLHCSYKCAKVDPDRTKNYYETCMKKYRCKCSNKDTRTKR